jgi:HEAT repeat protein
MTRQQELIRLFSSRATELEALQSLMGGTSMTHLRTVRMTAPVFEALLQGLCDPNPRARWWCVQLLDHSSDPRGITAVASMLDDPVPRVRQNATHALGCLACKPGWTGELAAPTLDRLTELAANDSHAKVRRHATWALSRQQDANEE